MYRNVETMQVFIEALITSFVNYWRKKELCRFDHERINEERKEIRKEKNILYLPLSTRYTNQG